MTRPRQVLPGQFLLITRRCTQRQFLLRPDDDTNNAFVYCLADAAQRFEIDVVLPYAASNHHHTVIFDRHGRYPQFMEHFHKMLARCMNARWKRTENLWTAQEPCATRLLDRATVIAKLIYSAANPVKDLLVERATQWPGVNGYRNLLNSRVMRAHRPTFFFSDDGPMPEKVELELCIPEELGPRDVVIAELRAGVESVERQIRDNRLKTGTRIVGRRALVAQSHRSAPTTAEPPRRLRPRFAGRPDVRIAALLAYKEFLASYTYSRQRWLEHREAVFPLGTYWLSLYAPVSTAPPTVN